MKYCERMSQSFLNEELEAWDSKRSAPWIIRQSLSWPRSPSPFAESEFYYHIQLNPVVILVNGPPRHTPPV